MKPKNRILLMSTIVVGSLALLPSDAQAAKTWSGAANDGGLWATAGNWVEGALPGTTETVNLDSSAANYTIALGANRTIRGINMGATAGAFTFSGNTLTIGDGGINMNAATQNLTISSAVAYSSSAQKWNVATGRALTVTGTFARAPETATNIQFSTTGTIKLGTAANAVLLDAQANPYATYGTNHWAATDATGTVTATAYTTYNASIGANTAALPLDVTASFTQTGNGGSPGIRFADTTTAHTLTIAGTTTFTGRGVLVTADCAGGTITGGFLRPNRANGGTARIMNIIQNSPNDFTIATNLSNSSASSATLLKTGPGKLILTVNNGYTSGTVIQEGKLQLGNGGASGLFGGGNVVNNAEIILNRSDVFDTLIHNISGTGSLTQAGTGEAKLTTSVSTFTGAVNINSGTLGVTLMSNLGSGTAININGGTFKFYGAIDPSARTITIGSSGATFDTNGQNITFAAAVGNNGSGNFTKTGTGSLTLTQNAGWTGNTLISNGTLIANATGSSTSGSVTVDATATLAGTGVVGGAVSTTSGSTLSPGANSVANLTVGALDLQSGSITQFEFGSGVNDRIIVNNANGLTLNGGTINLYEAGTGLATPFTGVNGTYNLFQFNGTLGGSINNLTIGNPQPGKGYTFGVSGNFVTLTVTDLGVNRNWVTNGSGNWEDNLNWNGSFPNANQAVANFITNLSAPATVSLNGSRTAGSLIFNSAPNGYTIAPGTGGSLILNNNGNSATITVNSGAHSITSNLSLSDSLELSLPLSGRSLTLSGAISGTNKSLTKTGAGNLSLLGANTFDGTLSLTGGSTTFAASGLGAGDIILDATKLVWDVGNTEDISSGSRTVYLVSGTVGFDTNGNDINIAGSIGDNGTALLEKTGSGRLTLQGDNTFSGGLSILNGEVTLGNGSTTGSVMGNILNNTQLTIHRSDTVTLNQVISGTGNLEKLGTNELILGGANPFTGETYLTDGTLTLNNALALQKSKIDYNSGLLRFGTVTQATIGSLTGSSNLSLQNLSAAAVALTVGDANLGGSYFGVLSGPGSFTKSGTGTLYLEGINTYTGATGINNAGGAVELINGGKITSTTALNIGTNTRFLVNSGEITASAESTISSQGFSLNNGFILVDGTATFNGGIRTGTNDGSLIAIRGGSFSASYVTLQRTNNYNALNEGPSSNAATYTEVGANTGTGFVVEGGTANISGSLTVGTSNSGSAVLISGGSTSVNGTVTIGNTSNGRWSFIDIIGGSFNANGTSGVVLSPATGTQNRSMLKVNGGTATLNRVGFGTATSAATSIGVLWLKAGNLYIGSGGLQQDAVNAFESRVRLGNGTLGAAADWSSSLPAAVEGALTIQAADFNGNAHHITLNGVLSGGGSLTKTGSGVLTLGGVNTYSGNTTVSAGTLSISQDDVFNDSSVVNVATGATLNLNHAGVDTVLEFRINGVSQGSGTFGGVGSGANHIIPQITGTGKLYVIPTDPYTPWTNLYQLTGNDALPESDPDKDGILNLMEFALNSSPVSSSASGKQRTTVELVAGEKCLTLTLPVRVGASFGGTTSKSASIDGLNYTIEGSDTLSGWNTMVITEVTPALSANMPELDSGWTYRTFRTPGSVESDPQDFIRARVNNN